LWSAVPVAAETLMLGPDDTEVKLGEYVQYLEDPDGQIRLETFLTPQYQEQLVQSTVATPNFGYAKSTYWLMVDLKNTGQEREFLLEIDNPLLGFLDIYWLNDTGIAHQDRFNSQKSFDERPIAHRNFLSAIKLEPNEKIQLVLKIKSTSILKLGIVLHDRNLFWEKDGAKTIVQGLYFGTMFVMIIYNCFIFITIKSRTYFFYVIYVTMFALWQLTLVGFYYQYISSDSVLSMQTISNFLVISIWSMCHFTRDFLNLKQTRPRIDWAVKFASFIYLALFVLGFFVPLFIWLKMIVGAVSTCAVLLMVTAILRVKQGSIEARYYTIALFSFFFGGILLALRNLGVLPSIFITDYGAQIGSVLEVVLLSLALARMMKSLQEENIKIQKEAADNLQTKVDERTSELKLKTIEAEEAKEESHRAHQEAVAAHQEADVLRHQAETQAEKLKEVDKQKTAFFQNMSHELRTPLTLILNPLENLVEKIPEDQDAAVAAKNARRLLRLVNQLLDFQKLKAGKKDLNLAPLDLSLLTHVCGEYFSSACQAQGVGFTLTRQGNPLDPHAEPLMVVGEIDALEKITFNYLSNALKHTPRHGRIEMGIVTEGRQVKLFVSDTGAGIEQDSQQKLFQVFSQIDESTTRAYEGSGLGLALVKSLAAQMGGAVGVESKPGEGSTFWVAFSLLTQQEIDQLKADGAYGEAHVLEEDFRVKPWLLEEVEGKTGQSQPELDEEFSTVEKVRILVIDDLADMRSLIAGSLKKNSYGVMTAANGKIGFELAQQHQPDLIVTDWMMPELSGPQLIQKLKADPAMSTIPVVLLTAKSDEESKIIGTEIGADAFLGKPFSEQELLSIVKNLNHLTETNKREVRHTKNLLMQSEKLSQMGAMISGIGHEIINPITLISLNSENEGRLIHKMDKALATIHDSDDDALKAFAQEFGKYIDRLRDICKHISIGSQRLRDLSHAIRTQSRYEVHPTVGVNINEVIEETILIVGSRLKHITVDVPSTQVAKMRCYRSKLGQVFTNVLSNAADALAEKADRLADQGSSSFSRQIEVISKDHQQEGINGVLITIADNGDGIPHKMQEKIFEQFYTSKPAGQGTGLGLSLSADIVIEHEGTIVVTEDEKLGGARFEIWLPLDPLALDKDAKKAS